MRVWDAASGHLVCTYSGHYEEVTGLVLVGNDVVSTSIDGTIRKWSLSRKDMLRYQEDLKKEANGEASNEILIEAKGSMLTAEEEAELAELIDDDD